MEVGYIVYVYGVDPVGVGLTDLKNHQGLVFHGYNIGTKLKFYLFPLTRLIPEKKSPLKKKIISIFSQDFFFKFHCKLRELSNVNSVILANCLCI